ncbi:MAG: hypothetical protein WCC65_15800, partial [Pseudonocardiaceae bacterium]
MGTTGEVVVTGVEVGDGLRCVGRVGGVEGEVVAGEEGGFATLMGSLALVLPTAWGAGTWAAEVRGPRCTGPTTALGTVTLPGSGIGVVGIEVVGIEVPTAGAPTWAGAAGALPEARNGTNATPPTATRATKTAAATRVLRREPNWRHPGCTGSTSNGVLVMAGRCGTTAGAGCARPAAATAEDCSGAGSGRAVSG